MHVQFLAAKEGFVPTHIVILLWFPSLIARQGIPFAGFAFQEITLGLSLCVIFGSKMQVKFLVYHKGEESSFQDWHPIQSKGALMQLAQEVKGKGWGELFL